MERIPVRPEIASSTLKNTSKSPLRSRSGAGARGRARARASLDLGPEPACDLASFVRAHGSFLGAALRRFGVFGADVDDLSQEVFLLAYRRWGTLELEGIRRWLWVVAANVARNHRRLSRHRCEVLMPEPPEGVVAAFDPIFVDVERRLSRRYWRMSRKLRQVFDRYELRGQTVKAISAELGVKEAAVYMRLEMAREWMGWG